MIQKTVNFTIDLDTNGNQYRLDAQQELIIFRIVQEVLHNIIRHAKATSIRVLFHFKPENVFLQIVDDGTGFDASQLNDKNYNGFGLGLRNMYNRAKIINADFNLVSTLEKGTTVTLGLKSNNAKS